MMAGVGQLKRICKDLFSVAGAVQETCSSEMLGGPSGFPEKGCILEIENEAILGDFLGF